MDKFREFDTSKPQIYKIDGEDIVKLDYITGVMFTEIDIETESASTILSFTMKNGDTVLDSEILPEDAWREIISECTTKAVTEMEIKLGGKVSAEVLDDMISGLRIEADYLEEQYNQTLKQGYMKAKRNEGSSSNDPP